LYTFLISAKIIFFTLFEKSYLNFLNGNQDFNNLRFLVCLTVTSHLMTFGDANLTVQSIVHKESKYVGISRLSYIIVYEIIAINCFYF
jgi:hypothetical protein